QMCSRSVLCPDCRLRDVPSFPTRRSSDLLHPLPPRYVSTVDSGNLSGHLLTLRQGLLAQPDAPVLAPATWQGLGDVAGVLVESGDRKSTRLNSSHVKISYAVFCLKKKQQS